MDVRKGEKYLIEVIAMSNEDSYGFLCVRYGSDTSTMNMFVRASALRPLEDAKDRQIDALLAANRALTEEHERLRADLAECLSVLGKVANWLQDDQKHYRARWDSMSSLHAEKALNIMRRLEELFPPHAPEPLRYMQYAYTDEPDGSAPRVRVGDRVEIPGYRDGGLPVFGEVTEVSSNQLSATVPYTGPGNFVRVPQDVRFLARAPEGS